MDERYVMHRLYSTRWSAIAGAALLGVIFLYQFFANNVERWDLLAVMIVMGVTKMVSMLLYRRVN